MSPDQVLPNPTANAYFNPAAFSNTVAGQYGNCARNNLRGPHQVNIDFSTIKDFRIAERQALQFRMEMFNAPNHVEWGSPSTSLGQFERRGAFQLRPDPRHGGKHAPDSVRPQV